MSDRQSEKQGVVYFIRIFVFNSRIRDYSFKKLPIKRRENAQITQQSQNSGFSQIIKKHIMGPVKPDIKLGKIILFKGQAEILRPPTQKRSFGGYFKRLFPKQKPGLKSLGA